MSSLALFDHYSFRARLQPALVTLLPLALGVFAWIGTGQKWASAGWTLFGTAGGTYLLAMLARNQGKQLEPGLWQSWGGAPTTQCLRHAGTANPVMRERWHKYLSKLLGKSFPTAQEETDNPNGADQIYEASVKLLINKTRDTKKFPLVYKENVHYGFCRNLYALRNLGIGASLIGLIASGAAGIWFAHTAAPQTAAWVCAVASVFLLIWWVFKIDSAWVKVPAFAYADRLLESTENLVRPKPSTSELPKP